MRTCRFQKSTQHLNLESADFHHNTLKKKRSGEQLKEVLLSDPKHPSGVKRNVPDLKKYSIYANHCMRGRSV